MTHTHHGALRALLMSSSRATLISASLIALTGCPDDAPSNENPSAQQDMGDMDMTPQDMTPPEEDASPDSNSDMPRPDMPDACVPDDTCTSCGMMPDGCGGMADCGVCECVSGVPQSPTCGVCGFGVSSCENTPGNGAATCSVDMLAYMPTECDTVVYVSTQAGPDTPNGTRENPFIDVLEAMEAARTTSSSFVAIAQGDYALDGQLELLDGVHVVGGFTQSFEFNEQGMSSLTITPTGPDKERIGVGAVGIVSKTWFKQFTIVTEDVPAAHNLYSFHATDSPGLHLEEVDIISGSILEGSSGKSGGDGADGTVGGDAAERTTLAKRAGDMTPNGYTNGANAGAAGTNPDCPATANGGSGGEGAHIVVTDLGGGQADITPFLPEPGRASASGLEGGEAGEKNSPDATDGSPGGRGNNGADGISGVSQGTIVRGFWKVEAQGTDGADGMPGEGGSGGGGTWWMEEVPNATDSKPGGSGGGGGGAGCGGDAGQGAQAGGSGFGMLLVASPGVVLDRVTINAPDGANGGNGGVGGQGGSGAVGGGGTTLYALTSSSTPQNHDHDAGRGGNGGNGGDGGTGGAGAGGSSFGIVCAEGTTVERIESVTVTAGTQGFGGTGPTPGQNGIGEDVVSCW